MFSYIETIFLSLRKKLLFTSFGTFLCNDILSNQSEMSDIGKVTFKECIFCKEASN